MIEQESPAVPRPDARRIHAWRPTAPADVGELRSRPHASDPQVSRVAACALGLAYAHREDVEGLQELVAIADADAQVLASARDRLATVEVADEVIRQRADTLLYTAVGHLDRLLT